MTGHDTAAPVLTVHDLAVRYGRAVAIERMSLMVAAGECLAVVGANGAGKSTLGKAVAGLVPAASGRIEYAGAPVARTAVRDGIVYVPEGRMVFPQLSVEENLKVGAFVRRRHGDWQERRDAMYALVPRLEARARVRAGLLSGGEQQLLAIARALMAEPRLLILDEPSLGLSPSAIGTVTEFLGGLRREGALSILLLEQNTAFAARLADRGLTAKLGRIDRDGLSQRELAEISVFQG
ncbi:ABC transporter ATP-binding protein [Nocardioides sp. L-11A]|uniref:ABC transporter ATP-binding protein n=1 Tax=Nocardioides sp. L-11A TaxID=3043848 RepID=UPI00249CEE04|nr:ABC transporter ATP-binding protein [Nocardioides sp. L-11A]